MDKFTILFLLGTFALICFNWADCIREDRQAYKFLSKLAWASLSWFVVYGLYHVVNELLRS